MVPDWANAILACLLLVFASARLMLGIVKVLRELLAHVHGLLDDLAPLLRSHAVRLGIVATVAGMVGIAMGVHIAASTTRAPPEPAARPFSNKQDRTGRNVWFAPGKASVPSFQGEAKAAEQSSSYGNGLPADRAVDIEEPILLQLPLTSIKQPARSGQVAELPTVETP